MQLLDPMFRNGPLQCFPQPFYATRIDDIIAGVFSGMRCGDVVAPNGSQCVNLSDWQTIAQP